MISGQTSLPSARVGTLLVLLLLGACGRSTGGGSMESGGGGESDSGNTGNSGGEGGVSGDGSSDGSGSDATPAAAGGQGAEKGGGTSGASSTGAAGAEPEGAGGLAGAPGNGSGGSPGEDERVGAVADLGAPCDSPSELACAGNYQRVTLICGPSHTWEVNETCPEGHACDSTEGFDQGTCKERLPECTNEEAGQRFCNQSTLMECGPDNVTAEVVEICEGVCDDGRCDDTRDACPEGDSYLGCSDDCKGHEDYCSPEYCPDQGIFTILLTEAYPGVVARIGSYTEACSLDCDPDVHRFSFGVTDPDFSRIKVTVRAPWRITAPQSRLTRTLSCEAGSFEGCLLIEPLSPTIPNYFAIFSDDPAANERNVTIQGGDDLTCP